MHGKERVIVPALGAVLGVEPELVAGLDTDAFGSFSRERPRPGSALDAARAKVGAAFARCPNARFGIASEGSFGPHPTAPWLAWAEELVLLVDRVSGEEYAGRDTGTSTNYAQTVTADFAVALAFGERVGFPGHGLIVSAWDGDAPAPALALIKDIDSPDALAAALELVRACGALALVETDMRAHRNPTRMAAVGRAAEALARTYASRCPRCAAPGYAVRATLPGLPCADCGLPTRQPRAERLACARCGHSEERAYSGVAHADPARCDFCNP
jgi:hypothetical protein